MKFIKKHRRAIIFVFIILLIGFCLRGIYRADIVPAYTQHFQITDLKNVYTDQYEQLGQPFRALGATYNTSQPHCSMVSAQYFSVSLYCYGETEATKIPIDPQDNKQIKAATNIDQRLVQNGWQITKESPDLASSITGFLQNPTYPGAANNNFDYGSGFLANKKIDKINCQLQLNADKTGQHIDGSYICSRTVNYFGNPN